MYKGNNLEVIHLNIFGCLLYSHIRKEKRTKLDPSRKKGIFVGYYEDSKSFRIYISGFHHINISRDVTFDKEVLKRSKNCQNEEVREEDVPPRKVEAAPSPESEISEDLDMLEP